MTAQEKRNMVAGTYAIIIGRNIYSQSKRDYCFKRYKDGNYYSDCSSSICNAYKKAGFSFGNLNTAGIYHSNKLTTVNLAIIRGIPDATKLRVGDMLEFAGNDSSRPKRIGHVEMVYSIKGSNVTLCGHGSGRPSYKNMQAYCRSRYNKFAQGGWRKGVVCVRRYIQDDIIETPKYKSGWHKENDSWYFYLGNCGQTVKNSWYMDKDGSWYFFNADGKMLADTWYKYERDHNWYYLDPNGAMHTGLLQDDGKWYYLEKDGKMSTKSFTLTPDDNGALHCPGLAL